MYSKRYIREFSHLMNDEGGLSKSKSDNASFGDEVHTAFGVTKKYYPTEFKQILQAHNAGNIELRDSLLRDFYHSNFWSDYHDQIESDHIAHLLFSFGVNASVKKATEILQMTLNYFFHTGTKVDSGLGKNTVGDCNSIHYQKPIGSAYAFFICVELFLNQFNTKIKNSVWKMLLTTVRDNDQHNIVGWIKRYFFY